MAARSGRATVPAAASSTPAVQRACAAPAKAGVAACLTLVRTDVTQKAAGLPALNQAPSGVGYGPSSLQSAYKLPSASAGAGQTVAVVDAYDDPTAVADLAAYRAAWGLPACNGSTGAGCLTKVNQNGATSPLPTASGSSGWATEESLDIDMVSAVCPNCRILLVESNSPAFTDLGAAVNSAVGLGAKYVSNSYGGAEFGSETTADSAYYNHPGVAVTASAGDSGYGVEFPAASPHVVAVGGTSLSAASNPRGWVESAWSGTGSGCSAVEPKPSWQTDSGCGRRTNNDVSAVADPATGVAVYDSYDQHGWLEVGGTSASSPIIASVYALAGTPTAGSYPASSLYAHASALNDVTSGSDGSCSPAYLCTAQAGYDGPTGLGTPNGLTAFGGGTPPLIAVLDGSGNVSAKQGGLSAGWVAEAGGISQVAVASDPVNGPLIAVLATNGNVYAKESDLSAGWVLETTGVKQIAVASDPVNGPLIAVLDTSGNASAKQGGLSAGWFLEATGVAQIAVASDQTHGPLIAVVGTTGGVSAKEGGLSAGWVLETTGQKQVAVASDPVNGPLIAVLDGSGNVGAKEGGLSAGWVLEATGVSQVSVASDSTNGPLIAVLGTTGNVSAKEGGLSAGWVLETTGQKQVAVASDPVFGPLIAVLDNGNNVGAKEGGLSAGWVLEANGQVQVSVAG